MPKTAHISDAISRSDEAIVNILACVITNLLAK